MNRTAGFTLIELLIALGISAVVAVGTVQIFRSTIFVKEAMLGQSDQDSQLTRALRVISRDITQFVPNRPVRDPYGQYKPAIAISDYDGLSFTRSGWADSPFLGYERSKLQRVRYQWVQPGAEHCPLLEDDAKNELGGCLLRSYTVHLDDDGSFEWTYQTILRPVEEPEWQFLVKDGTSEEMSYKDEPPAKNGQPETPDDQLLAIKLEFVSGSNNVSKTYLIPREPVK
ncbi:MAG: type II secretion system minor pseudopilin GspJ [Reinekea sp.]|jgi:general secretion pathway protein J